MTMIAVLTPMASAAVTTFGSPLSVPATLNTVENLSYAGTNTPYGNGYVHTYHNAADDAIWNAVQATGAPQAPSEGQAIKVRLEGCAKPATGGPAPLTQIHFQDITPLPGGGAKVNLTSQPFEIPICGQNGASGSTITSYEPVNLCVNQGDYIDFNDEGGWVPSIYQSGVPYQVIGSVVGSTLDSFLRGNGTNNGATMSASETSAMDGFVSDPGQELMLQVELGTGPDARYVCPGGTKEAPPAPHSAHTSPYTPKTPVALLRQQDGVNQSRVVGVAVYCRLVPRCVGTAVLGSMNGHVTYGTARFSVKGKGTAHVSVRLSGSAMAQLRKHHKHLTARLTVTVGGIVVSQAIGLYA